MRVVVTLSLAALIIGSSLCCIFIVLFSSVSDDFSFPTILVVEDNNTKKVDNQRYNTNGYNTNDRGRQNNYLQSKDPSTGAELQSIDNFFVHIPKSAGTAARDVMNNLFRTMSLGDQVVCDHTTDSHLKYRQWSSSIITPAHSYPIRNCKMHMSESIYPSGMNWTHVYTILRPPHEHVLSQYFHCKESRFHKRKELMPSLDGWLSSWVPMMETKLSQEMKQLKNRHFHSMFNCYNPINFQSYILQFAENLSPESSKMDLKQRFDVIGLTTHFDKSICLIMIHLTGKVPKACDCTSRRRLRKSHGVTHHGALFKTSESQMHAISNLTKVDQRVFQYAEELFEIDVKRAEEKYAVQLCDNLH